MRTGGERLITFGRIPDCERCGGDLVVFDEERITMVPPVFELECRCHVCGFELRVRQVLTHFE